MRTRHITAAILAAGMLLFLAACGAGTAEPPQSVPAAPQAAARQTAPDGARQTVPDAGTGTSPGPGPGSGEPVELIVFAAASLKETLTEIAERYRSVAPNVTIVCSFDSSGTLKTQIQEGADVDLFISAAPKQMDQLDASVSDERDADGLDFVRQGSRIDLLENKVALAVPADDPKGIESFDDLAGRLREGSVFLAMGNSDVPVGQYTQKILAYYGLSEDELNAKHCLTYGSNVKEVTTQIGEGTVDCGVIYATDAFSAGLRIVDTATAEMCGRVVYPAAVMNACKAPEAAQAFLDYLTGPEASAVFESVGFSVMGR